MISNSSIIPQNYENLLNECREIITEHEFTSRWELVVGYHAVGEKINKVENVTVTQLANDLQRPPRFLQRCKQFYKKFPDLSLLPEPKNTSWHKIVNKYLPETVSKEERRTTCPKCGYQW